MSELPDMQAGGEALARDGARSGPLAEEAVESVAARLRVLGDPTRIRLIELLKDRSGATVSALTACMRIRQQSVSSQLAILHRAGVVKRRREGMWVRYELADWSGWWLIDRLAEALDADPDARGR